MIKKSVPEKYNHIDFKPPKSVAKAAERGLELRREQEGDKAGLTTEEAGEQDIGSGVQRAVNLKNRDAVSPETINDMVGFFARFNKNISKARKLKTRKEQVESNMYVSDLLWGGKPGEKWANKVQTKMKKADEEQKKSHLARRVLSRVLVTAGKGRTLARSLSSKYDGLELYLSDIDEDLIVLEKIEIHEDQRGTGVASEVMEKLINWADQTNTKIALTPSSDFGANKQRLISFYRRFGFQPNKNEAKDFRVSETMIYIPGD